jgi:hypothetical protein
MVAGASDWVLNDFWASIEDEVGSLQTEMSAVEHC